MTRYEIKKNKEKQRRRMVISISLMAVGLALVITAAIMEASHYPWGLLFGTATQNAEMIPDPSPIRLDEEDQNVIITEEVPETNTAAPVSNTAAPSDEPAQSADLPGNVVDTEKAPAVTKFVIIGALKIPVLNVSQNVLEGAGKQMKYGVGHVPSTAGIGQRGNCAIAGHRPYPFRYLDQMKTGDSIVIKSGGVTYTYTVFNNFAVLPNEVWVLNSIPGEDYTLTLITCTPYMVSSHRLIIWARLTDINGQSPQDYYGITSPDTTPAESAAPASTDTSPTPPEVTVDIAAPSAASDTVTASPATDVLTTDSPPISP